MVMLSGFLSRRADAGGGASLSGAYQIGKEGRDEAEEQLQVLWRLVLKEGNSALRWLKGNGIGKGEARSPNRRFFWGNGAPCSSAARQMPVPSSAGSHGKGERPDPVGRSCRSCGVPSVDPRMRPTCASYRVMAQSDVAVRPEKTDDLLLPDEAVEKVIMYFPCLELVVYNAN